MFSWLLDKTKKRNYSLLIVLCWKISIHELEFQINQVTFIVLAKSFFWKSQRRHWKLKTASLRRIRLTFFLYMKIRKENHFLWFLIKSSKQAKYFMLLKHFSEFVAFGKGNVTWRVDKNNSNFPAGKTLYTLNSWKFSFSLLIIVLWKSKNASHK